MIITLLIVLLAVCIAFYILDRIALVEPMRTFVYVAVGIILLIVLFNVAGIHLP